MRQMYRELWHWTKWEESLRIKHLIPELPSFLCMSLFRLGLGFYCSTKSLLLPRQTLQERSPKLRVGPLCQNVCSSNLSELLDAVVAQITCQNFWVTEFALVTWLNVSPSMELEWELDATLNENALVLVRPCF